MARASHVLRRSVSGEAAGGAASHGWSAPRRLGYSPGQVWRRRSGTGHHHLLIDGKPLPKGEVVPATDKSLHFGKGQTETDLTLPPGDHTLTLQFGDGAHRSYGPEMSKTITVHVK
ncbi:hypothetical protein HDG32_001793 [Paraburkholderia sp. CI2]|uniref:DUF4399 domain-containing protein n=1 Tax=unclassified Paraburkholderia TaxID=2615204 RepID=UPI001838C016|nr:MULTISPECIES: DUF4399 domain-containing protein [unclassified Paraburkholderia]MBB5465689.1 hypothetical protein [Paraburkholderia sp. CI2]